MNYDTKQGTITVNDVTYDVERNDSGDHTILTLAINGEPVFEGIEGRIGYDDMPEHNNPRDWCNVGKMLVNYNGYTLGDGENDEFEVDCEKCEGNGSIYVEGPQTEDDARLYYRPFVSYECEACEGNASITLDPASYYRKKYGARVVLPLFVYEHSGITISAGAAIEDKTKQNDVRSTGRFMGDDAGWDTSFVGFIFDTPEQVKECIGDNVTDEDIEKALEQEVEIYASYLEGDVTYYRVEDDETDFDEGCGGYVGDSKHCENECFASLETAIESRLAEQQERDEMAARDIETV